MRVIAADTPEIAADVSREYRRRRVDRMIATLLAVPPPEPKEPDGSQED